MDADYKPDKLASGQLPGEEAAQEVHQMAAQLSQVQPTQPTACMHGVTHSDQHQAACEEIHSQADKPVPQVIYGQLPT